MAKVTGVTGGTMKKLALAVVGALFLAGSIYAQAPATAHTTKPVKQTATKVATRAPRAMTARGEIVSADSNSVTVKTSKGNETFAIGPETKIMQGAKAVTPSDLANGERATIQYTKSGEQMTATHIAVAAPRKPKK
jgi:hypothetical protein